MYFLELSFQWGEIDHDKINKDMLCDRKKSMYYVRRNAEEKNKTGSGIGSLGVGILKRAIRKGLTRLHFDLKEERK